MAKLTLADFALIYPRNGMWQKLRLPPFPPARSVLIDSTPELERELGEAFDLISLIEKKDGSRRSFDGVNRAAQNRWPGRRIYIDLVYQVLTAWQVAGADAVIELVCGGKYESNGQLVFRDEPENAVLEMAAAIHEPEAGSEMFVAVTTVVLLREQPGSEIGFYRVAAQARFGQYRFDLACHRPPEPEDVSRYCLLAQSRLTAARCAGPAV